MPRRLRAQVVPHNHHLRRHPVSARQSRQLREEIKNEARAVQRRAHLGEAEVVEERDDIADDVEDGVGCRVSRGAGVAQAAEVGGQGAEAARGHLVTPRQPELREAVQEEHRRAGGGTLLGHVEGQAVHVGVPVPHTAVLLHGLVDSLLQCYMRFCGQESW